MFMPEKFKTLNLEAFAAENKFNSMEHKAKLNAINYISPSANDIAEAGEDWKQGGVRYFLETCDFRNDSGTLTQISDIHTVEALPAMEVEELKVINIELSDYPVPENVTSYDWWWVRND